jgi:hypothetical protein
MVKSTHTLSTGTLLEDSVHLLGGHLVMVKATILGSPSKLNLDLHY